MKLLIIAIALLSATVSNRTGCNKKSNPACYQGRLEVKGICANYTVAVIGGNLPGVQASWTDETTEKTYTNVFSPANPCSLPNYLKEGDSFYFVVDSAAKVDCIVCMAAYPTPEAKLSIRVLPGSCSTQK